MKHVTEIELNTALQNLNLDLTDSPVVESREDFVNLVNDKLNTKYTVEDISWSNEILPW